VSRDAVNQGGWVVNFFLHLIQEKPIKKILDLVVQIDALGKMDLAQEGARGNDCDSLICKGAELATLVWQIVVEVHIFTRILTYAGDHLFFEPIGMCKDEGVQGITKKDPDFLEQLGLDKS
jgi:hypothetical protein